MSDKCTPLVSHKTVTLVFALHVELKHLFSSAMNQTISKFFCGPVRTNYPGLFEKLRMFSASVPRISFVKTVRKVTFCEEWNGWESESSICAASNTKSIIRIPVKDIHFCNSVSRFRRKRLFLISLKWVMITVAITILREVHGTNLFHAVKLAATLPR